MSLKFRIITNSDRELLYTVEQKYWFFWRRRISVGSIERAEFYIKKSIELALNHKSGRIIKEYTEEDYLADKLKGNV